MTDTTGTQLSVTRPAGRVRNRAVAVGGTGLATTLIWLAAQALDIELRVEQWNGEPTVVNLPTVIGSTLGIALLGWATLAVLERFTGRARTSWTVLATVVLLLSLVMPLSAEASTATKVVLSLMHVAVGAVLIPALRR